MGRIRLRQYLYLFFIFFTFFSCQKKIDNIKTLEEFHQEIMIEEKYKEKKKKDINLEKEYAFLFKEWTKVGFEYDFIKGTNNGVVKRSDKVKLEIKYDPKYPDSIIVTDMINDHEIRLKYLIENIFIIYRYTTYLKHKRIEDLYKSFLIVHRDNLISFGISQLKMGSELGIRNIYICDETLPSADTIKMLEGKPLEFNIFPTSIQVD